MPTVKVGNVVASVPTGWLGEDKVRRKRTTFRKESSSQSRVEAVRHRAARAGEGGLSGRMVFHVELKSDGVSWLGSDVAGRECEKAGTTHDDTVICASGGS